jgi:hypothetical protein
MKVAFINIMKRITAYVNTTTVHWLAEELIAAGVKEMRVIEHFSPTSQISRLQLCCEDDLVGQVREIIRRLGATGSPPDYDIARPPPPEVCGPAGLA